MNTVKILLMVGVVTVFAACGPESDSNSEIDKIEIKKHLVIKPGPLDGADVSINNSIPTERRRNKDFIGAVTWTIFGERTTTRSLLEFTIPEELFMAKLDSAILLLHPLEFSVSDPTFDANSGNNSFYILRTTSSWNQDSVSWVNQPDFTYKNACLVPKVALNKNKPLRIKVSDMLADQLKDNDSKFGLMFKLKEEKIYSRILMASSNFQDSAMHPSLELFFSSKK